MEGYLGEKKYAQEGTIFKDFTKNDWVMYFLEQYGGFDGSHHKDWVLDQIARICKGTPVIIKLARWEGGHFEWRVSLGEPSQEYLDWVVEMKSGEDGSDTYEYFEGIAP
jgi:hypothetical protein